MVSSPDTSLHHTNLTITTPTSNTNDRSATIAGVLTDSAGGAVLGRAIEIDEGNLVLGTAVVDANGRWSADVLLPDLGANTITARTVGTAGDSVASAPIVLTLDTVLSETTSLSGTCGVASRVHPAHGAEVSAVGAASTFVFRPHPGHAVIDGFGLSGFEADHLSLPCSRFSGLADVLRHTTMTAGDAVIHLSPVDSITLTGVSKAGLKADKGAILFHL